MATKKSAKVESPKDSLAIVAIGSHQYSVRQGDEIKVEKVTPQADKKFTSNEVLLYSSGDNAQFGAPYLKNVSVNFEHLGDSKSDKIRVAHFRSKSRYRKVKGHRQTLSTLKVIGIDTK